MPSYNIGLKVITKVHMLITATPIKYDKSNNKRQSHENANYFLGGVDKSFTYAGIVLYLEQNGVHPTSVKMVKN